MNSEAGIDNGKREELFDCLKRVLTSAQLIEDALRSLSMKRETLEEKMIKMALNRIVIAIAETIRDLHSFLIDEASDIDAILSIKLRKDGGSLPETASASLELEAVIWKDELATLAHEMEHCFLELNKIIAYDWNFLEQYYEHEFYARLLDKHRFQERLQILREPLAR